GVDAELGPQPRPGGVVALRVDAVAAAVLEVTGPGDDERTAGVQRDRRVDLRPGRVRVDLELAALRRSGGAVPLGEDPVAAAVLRRTLPSDDEVPGRVHSDRRGRLAAGRVSVDAE